MSWRQACPMPIACAITRLPAGVFSEIHRERGGSAGPTAPTPFSAGRGIPGGTVRYRWLAPAWLGLKVVTLPQVFHSQKYGSAWYGSSGEIIRRWWPDGVSDGR